MLTLARRVDLNIVIMDVKEAHLNGKVGPEDGQHYVQAPAEAYKVGMCWKLKRWLYRITPAARVSEIDYAERVQSEGMLRGTAAPA